MSEGRGGGPTLDDFVARWLGVLEVWCAEKDLSLSRVHLQHLIEQLFSWFGGGMFLQRVPAPRAYPQKATAAPTDLKETKWEQYRDAIVKRLSVLEEEGWTMVLH